MEDCSEKRAAEFVAPAGKSIHIQLVERECELNENGRGFHPEFTHQMFGENESIFGYKEPRVDVLYGAATLTTYLGFSYAEKGTMHDLEGAKPDSVEAIIGDKLASGFLRSKDEFCGKLAKEPSFGPFGDLKHVYTVDTDSQYEIYQGNILTPRLREYHARLQTFVLWFIDAASFIDVDDENWEYFFVFKRKKLNGQVLYCIIGYATVYKYYAFPDKKRPRISQFLILPPFQRQGHGAQLLQTIYNHYIKDERVLDITVEDPSDEFTALRDFVDAGNCAHLSSYQPPVIKNGFTQEMVKQAQEQLKINKQQARKVYEILRLKVTDQSDPLEYKSYRLDVKRRLNKPFQAELEKLKRVLEPSELAVTIASTGLEERHQKLSAMYEVTEELYRRTIEKLAAA